MQVTITLLWVLSSLLLASRTTEAFTAASSARPRTISIGSTTAVNVAEESTTSDDDTSASTEEETYVRCGKCQATYPISPDELGGSRGRRLECSVCQHTWFQSKDRVMTIRPGFDMVELPQRDLDRIQLNIQEGRPAGYMGETKIYVGNIAFECHEDDLMAEFSKIGEVGDVSLVRDEEGNNRGFGFVTMRTKEDGQAAIDLLDGAPVRGRKIAVRESNN